MRLDQQVGGVRVWGADVVVHLAPGDGQVLLASGNLLTGADLAVTQPTISAQDAIGIGTSQYVAWAGGGQSPFSTPLAVGPAVDAKMGTDPALDFERESAELVVYARAGEPVLAWNVEFFTEQQAGLDPGRWNFFIDAHSGQIVDWFDGLAHAQASGPGGNAKVGSRPWVEALDVEETGTPDLYAMDTARQITTNLFGATSGTGTVVTGPLDPIGDAAINDAHGFTEITLNMLDEWFGYDSIDNAGFKIVSRVHYDVNYPNAFWEDGQVTYGDGDLGLGYYPTSGAIDFVSHEIHHGFTEFHSGLTFPGEPGALDESFSDIAGTVAEFYSEGLAADFLIFEDVNVIGFERSMTDPTADGFSIDDAIRFSPGLDVHATSGIGNKAFARTALRLSSGSPTGPATVEGVRRAGEAWFLANESYWTASTDYTQGGQGVYDAAEALGFTPEELLAIRDSWADVGVFFEGGIRLHDELLTAASGTLTSPNFPSNYPHNYKHTWAIDPPGEAPVTLAFSSFQVLGTVSDALEIRDGAGNLLSRTTSSVLPPPATATRLLVTFATSPSGSASGWSASWTSAEIAAGDYNQDTNVDAADYVVWRKTLGTTGVPANSGADGEIGQGDYDVWTANFGETAPPGAGTGASRESRVESQESSAELLETGFRIAVFGLEFGERRESRVKSREPGHVTAAARRWWDDALVAWLASRTVDQREDDHVDVVGRSDDIALSDMENDVSDELLDSVFELLAV